MVARIWLSNFNLFSRKSGLSVTLTVTLSKKASIGARKPAKAFIAPAKSSALQRRLHRALDLRQARSNGLLLGLFQQCDIGAPAILAASALSFFSSARTMLAARP